MHYVNVLYETLFTSFMLLQTVYGSEQHVMANLVMS
jgi:hypothetical protein